MTETKDSRGLDPLAIIDPDGNRLVLSRIARGPTCSIAVQSGAYSSLEVDLDATQCRTLANRLLIEAVHLEQGGKKLHEYFTLQGLMTRTWDELTSSQQNDFRELERFWEST